MNTSALTVSLRHTVCSDFQADSRWRKEAMQSIVCKRPVTFFSLIFVSTFRALAIYQHTGAHHKLHVVLCSRSDWCRVYVLCVQCAHWPKRESVRKKERERERESSKWTPYTYTGWEHREKESDPLLVKPVGLHLTCLIKGTEPEYDWMEF